MEAIVYKTENDLTQSEAGRLRMVGGRIVPTTSDLLVRRVLDSRVVDLDREVFLTADDGEDFLRALPAEFTGSRIRVELVEDGTKSVEESKQLIQPMLRPAQPNVWEDSPRQVQPVVNVNLVVPPEAIRVVVEQVAPVVNVEVKVPEQKTPDVVVNLPEIRFPEIPAPVVNVEVPKQSRPVVNIEVPEQSAPVVHVETQPVNVEVKVPKQTAPVVNVEAPVVNVTPNIDVIVPPKQKPRRATITHADGTVSEIEVE